MAGFAENYFAESGVSSLLCSVCKNGRSQATVTLYVSTRYEVQGAECADKVLFS